MLRQLIPSLLLLPACPVPANAPCPAWQPPQARAQVEDDALSEVSGLSASRLHAGVLYALQDSGPGQRSTVWALHHDGSVAARLEVDAPNVDWEALAVGPCPAAGGWCIYVADIGDNTASRSLVTLHSFPEPLTLQDARITPQSWRATYPDGPQDAEALVVTTDAIPVILTKRVDGQSRIFAWEGGSTTTPITLAAWGSVDVSRATVGGLPHAVTDASLSPDGARLLVRTYLGAWEYFLGPDGLRGLPAASRDGIPFVPQLQTEAVAYDPQQPGFWQMAEGPSPRMWLSRCLAARSSHP